MCVSARYGLNLAEAWVRFVVDKMALEQVSLRVLKFSPVIITPTLHTHFHLHVARTRRTNGVSLGTLQKAVLYWKSGSIG